MLTWTTLLPAAAAATLGASFLLDASAALLWWCVPMLVGAVLAAVHHAEVVAHRVGEPFGTLVLALAITVIEVALIVSLMLSGEPGSTAALPRDTIFATVMIIGNGVVGLCLWLGGLRHHEQHFHIQGAASALAALVALCSLSLVLPTFTTSTPGPTYSPAQLGFAAVASVALWGVFVFAQTVSHRDYFLPAGGDAADEHAHAQPPGNSQAWMSFALLLVALVSVVGLAKLLSPTIERAVLAAGAPKAVIGIAIALLVLLPETLAAVRAARANRLQTSLNLALGSALASIGLTIPAVAVASLWLGLPLEMGLPPKDLVMLTITFLVSAITLASGRTAMMQGAVHLVLFAAFLFLTLVP